MTHPLLDLIDRRVVILDGAMGTNIHRYDPSDADWGGRDFVNLCDVVARTHPDWIRNIHRAFLHCGCDAVETNTFNGSKLVLAEFGIADQCLDLNKVNVRLAREAVAEFSTPERPRFVIGSVGPGTRQPSITDPKIACDFDTLYDSYEPQMRGLLEGGVDAVLIETCFDSLQSKIAAICALDTMRKLGIRVPVMVQVTILQNGTMLAGSDMATAITTLEAFPEIDVIGINCALGPADMVSHVQQLSVQCTRRISCLPNAGLPETIDGRAVFPLGPVELADWLEKFVKEYGVNVIGGCCGTTTEHLHEVVKRLHGVKAPRRKPVNEPAVTSLHSTAALRQEPRPLLVGERTNTNGSRKFKQLLEAEDWHKLVDMAREQEREGVHVLDVCTAFVGRDEVRDMTEVVRRYNEIIRVPLMIDSTEPPVIEAALKLISGKAIINSINLEEGRKKIDTVVPLARRYGAALVALTIDEQGQATTADWKFRVAKRMYDICTQEYGVPPSDLLFDPLVFPVTTGQDDLRTSALETINAIKRIKADLPGALTHVGLSNVSFGLHPYARQVVNSVFLHYALEAGLDSAILHAAKIIPLARIDETGRDLARRLILNEREQGDPLRQLIEHYADKKAETASSKGASLGESVEERLRQAIIQGRRETLIADLDAARERFSPIDIINTILLDGMKVVGDLFGSGQMQLPFVLQSAEVMKAAVAHLEKFMEKVEGTEKGKIVLATVKGDVHDIGKNLVDIILTNNGYRVYNLGIKQPIETILHAAQEHAADAIGMSGLLVKSTVVMKEDLLALNDRNVTMPVILGGAALTRRYVEVDLRQLYKGPLYYGEDAFAGLHIMDELCAPARRAASGSVGLAALQPRKPKPAEPAAFGLADKGGCRPKPRVVSSNSQRSSLQPAPDRPPAPFWGSKIATDISMMDVFRFLNERTLFSTQWQFRKGNAEPAEYERQMREVAEPVLARLKQQCLAEKILRPGVVYGFFPCASDGNDLLIYQDDRRTERLRFTFPRQDGGEHLCLSDYFTAGNGEAADVVAFMAVTMGPEVSRRAKALFEAGRYTDYLYLHGLGVESAEALAEFWHQRVRQEWGIAGEDAADVRKLFKKHYRGCRYSFGYPACPALEDQVKLFEQLRPERIGLALSDQFQLEPEQSTTAVIVHHPAAKYFNVGASQPDRRSS
jgi:5-methyltetrahydrofolate--homocysteine methyltransferase